MVGLRTLPFAARASYQFGDWPRELFYEYLKDVRSYIGFVVLVSFYRLLLRRLQGEARLLAEPDEGRRGAGRAPRTLPGAQAGPGVPGRRRRHRVAAGLRQLREPARARPRLPAADHDAGIEARLDPRVFARVHRSYMVNLGQVASIEPLDAGEARLHLRDGTVLPCSRSYRTDLRGRVGARAGESLA